MERVMKEEERDLVIYSHQDIVSRLKKKKTRGHNIWSLKAKARLAQLWEVTFCSPTLSVKIYIYLRYYHVLLSFLHFFRHLQSELAGSLFQSVDFPELPRCSTGNSVFSSEASWRASAPRRSAWSVDAGFYCSTNGLYSVFDVGARTPTSCIMDRAVICLVKRLKFHCFYNIDTSHRTCRLKVSSQLEHPQGDIHFTLKKRLQGGSHQQAMRVRAPAPGVSADWYTLTTFPACTGT